MGTKIASASTGRIRKTINKPSVDERIMQLHRELGMTAKQAYRELQWINVKVQARSNFINA